jgi:tripartite-type tricarboxylate transporter receptor subunit TctC
MKTLFVLATTAAIALTAQAQDWPQRPVRVIVPFAAGASPDILARIVNDKLASRIGQPLIVENKPGAGGNSGTDQASKAAPDGYTFLLSVNAPLVYNTILYKNLPYDPFKDLVPVSLAATTPNVCAVSNGMNVDSVKGWLDAMKRNPGQFNFASTGNGSISHLGVELIKLKTRSFAVHIPYASSGQAVTAIIQGDVQFACLPPVSVMPQAKAGRLKAIAVTSAERSGLLPELPTLRESGLPDIQAVPWFAYMAPKGTPDAIVQRMSREIAAVLKDPEVQKRLQTAYFDPVGSTPEALSKFMGEELRRWKPVIERTGLKPD